MEVASKDGREEKPQQTSEDPTLPSEIIVVILSRLPVKSLLRFRSVCKLWCSTISDPYFVKSHLTLSNNNSRYAHHRLMFFTVTRSLKSCPLYDLLYGESVNALEHYDVLYDESENGLEREFFDYPNNLRWMVGSCNGLLCIRIDNDNLLIWNPSTRRSNGLPLCCFMSEYDWRYGFVYDKCSDDYLVVGTFCQKDEAWRYDLLVKIYSLKNGSWKKVDDFHNAELCDLSVKILNGALHWAAYRHSESYCTATQCFVTYITWTIVSLDLATETYGEILHLGKYDEYDDGYESLTLGTLGEWLCVLANYYCFGNGPGDRADVWVMKEYGIKDSWTKIASIPYMFKPECPSCSFSMPLCISNDGKLLLQFWLKLVVYDSKNGSYSVVLDSIDEHISSTKGLYAGTFVESLVSPDSPAYVGDNNQDCNQGKLGCNLCMNKVNSSHYFNWGL